MQKLSDKLKLMKWKPVVKSLDKAMDNVIEASENTYVLKKYSEIENRIDDANRKISEAFDMIAKQIEIENPSMDKEYIRSLVENKIPDEENPEWLKLEKELEDLLAEKYLRADAREMVETLDMEWLLSTFEDEERLKILERDYL